MNNLQDDIPVGIYRCIDDIKHFKIKVFIRKTPFPTVPHGELEHKFSDGSSELLSFNAQGESCSSHYTFSWQEKVPKVEEMEDSAAQLCSKNDEEVKHIRLFSYVDSETHSQELVWCHYNEASTRVPDPHKSALFYLSGGRTYQKPFILASKDVVQTSHPSRPSRSGGQTVVIMACFGKDSDSEEVQLCVLHYNISGVLTVVPDFNHSPYFIRTFSSGVYEYKLEQASNSLKLCDANKEKNFRKQVAEHHAKALNVAVGNVFDVPSPKSIFLYLSGEIISGKDFDAKHVFVRYSFQLPEGVEPLSEGSMSGTTHTCKMKTIKGHTEAHFGFPLTFAAEIEPETLKQSGKLNPMMEVTLELCSVDSWGICRNEGFGLCGISLCPGDYFYDFMMVKLLPQTFFDMLKSYFIGGMPSLKDHSYMRLQKNFQDSRINRYGGKTQASGSLALKLSVLLQFGCETSPKDFIHQQQVSSNY